MKFYVEKATVICDDMKEQTDTIDCNQIKSKADTKKFKIYLDCLLDDSDMMQLEH